VNEPATRAPVNELPPTFRRVKEHRHAATRTPLGGDHRPDGERRDGADRRERRPAGDHVLGSGTARARPRPDRRDRRRGDPAGRVQQPGSAAADRAGSRASHRVHRAPRTARIVRRCGLVAGVHRHHGAGRCGQRRDRRRRRRRAARAAGAHRAVADRTAPGPGRGHQPGRRAVHGGRPRARVPGAGRGGRVARLRRPAQPRAGAAARPVRLRHPPARESQGPDRLRERVRAARRDGRLRLRLRAGVGRAHRLERQPHALRGTGLHRRAATRRRRVAAARRGAAGDRGDVPKPLGLCRLRRGPGRGGPALPPAPARPRAAGRPGPAGHAQRVGGRLLRTRRGPAAGPRRACGGRGRRTVRAGRRLVRCPPPRSRRAGRLGGLPRGLAARPAPAGGPGPRAGHAVRALVRAGDGQPGLGRGPRAPGVDHGGPRGVAGRASPRRTST
jgi:hypothetical protein